MLGNQLKRNLIAVLAACLFLLAGVTALHATLPQLEPVFSTQPTTITAVYLAGTSATLDDMMAEVTFEGAYNQLQGTNRLYVSTNATDTWWLKQGVPPTVTVSTLSFTGTDPDGALKAMLAAYGPQGTNSVSKYIICDPVNNPESCNMATTMAGINQAMVVYPDNLSLMTTYGMTQFADLRNVSAPTGSQYVWVGSDSTLVGDTNVNWVHTPGGGSGGTTGWSTNCAAGQTLGTATYLGKANAIKWTSLANEGTICVAQYAPAPTLGGYYTFSVQVAGSGNVYLDAWQGVTDIQSSTITLNSTAYQTLQLTVPVPSSDNSLPVKIQVRANTTGNAITAYFINSAVVNSNVAVDTYQYNNLIASTNSLAPASLTLDSYDFRDYMVAAKLFSFYTGSDTAGKTLFGNILSHYASNTPVLGYVTNETPDLAFLSAPPYDMFQVVSDRRRNASVWASFPGPATLSQPAPAGIKAQNGYIYVGFFVSDGDNSSFMQNQNQAHWTNDQWLGAVPLGWTSGPSTISWTPELYNYYYQFLPQSNEMMAGPSGVGYQTAMTGTDLATFASLSNQFMTALRMNTVNAWMDLDAASGTTPANLQTFATDVNVSHAMWFQAIGTGNYQQQTNTAKTVIDGQVIGFASLASQVLTGIQNYVSSNCPSSTSPPCFIPAQVINAYIGPEELEYVAQQLQRQGNGRQYVFLTPSELALTEANYHNGGTLTATSNAQAVPGNTLIYEYPNDYAQNPNGLLMTGITGLFSLNTTGNHETLQYANYLGLTRYYQGGGGRVQLMTRSNTANDVIAQAVLQTVPIAGQTYHFQMQVAGTGTAKIGVYNGSAWTYSSTVTLTPAWQTLSVYTQAPATGGLFQVILPANQAASVYFSNATNVPNNWAMDAVTAGSTEDLTSTIYNYTPALLFTLSASQGHVQEIFEYPPVKASTSYTWSADVAGSGKAYLQANDGSTLCFTPTVTLTAQYQHLACTASTLSTGSPDVFIISPANTSAETIYVRNVSVIEPPTFDFFTSVETGEAGLNWTNTVDTTSPGGGLSNVTSPVLQLTTTEMSHRASNAVQYGGTASGGASNYAYMKAFSNSTVLGNSRLSYWIFPQGPHGAEPNASSTTGTNSTCVAVDIIFTDGTALRNLGMLDQYGNQLHPAHQCNHLIPDQWNYVTSNISSLSGKTVSRIDIGYDQPGSGAAGSYRGYVDDISLTR